MTQRRTIGSAMTLTPDKLAFIGGSAALKEPEPQVAPAMEENPTQLPDMPYEQEATPKSTPSPRRKRGEGTSVADHNSFVGELLVPLTTRLQPGTANALRRACLEQKLRHAKPDRQQDIVEEALANWLSRQGFLG